jgi:hypothetical protein
MQTFKFVREIAAVNPIHVSALYPSSINYNSQREHMIPYPNLGPGQSSLRGKDWKNPNPADVVAALRRASKLTSDELLLFANAYIHFHESHFAAFSTDRTMRWIMTGKTNLYDVRACLVPKAAMESLTADEQAIAASDNWQHYVAKSEKQGEVLLEGAKAVLAASAETRAEEVARTEAAKISAAAERGAEGAQESSGSGKSSRGKKDKGARHFE